MTVTLKPDLEEELTARAQAEGLSTQEFVNRELEKLVASMPSSPLSDYAVSREGIYSREDEML